MAVKSYEQHANDSNSEIQFLQSILGDTSKNLNKPGELAKAMQAWENKKGIRLGSGSSGGSTTSISSSPQEPRAGINDALQKFIKSQGSGVTMTGMQDEMINLENSFDILFNKEGQLNKGMDMGRMLLDKLIDRVAVFGQQQTGLLKIINEEAGLTGDYARDFRDALTDANPRLLELGISFGDLSYAAKQTVDDSGKFATISRDTWERAGEVAKSYVGTLGQLVTMYPEFAKVGLGAASAQERIAKAGKDAVAVGLQAQKVTKDISANLGRLNEYGFKNGVDGLSAMVRKSIEFKTSMDSVFAVAEKVFSPEGAIELSANLQVLGGAIGDFNDPLKLMYMATNNVEGLQDALVGAAGSLATYNQQQGRFEVTGANLRRAKEMANALGISMKELNTTAIAAAERTQASTALMARGFVLDEKQKAFLTNIAQMKEGRMVIELGASKELKDRFGKSEVAIEELSQEQVSTILKYQDELKELSQEEIIKKQATDIGNIERMLSSTLATGAKTLGRGLKYSAEETLEQFTGKNSKEYINQFGDFNKNLRKSMEGFEQTMKDGTKDLWKTTSELYEKLTNNFFNKEKAETKKEPETKAAPKVEPAKQATTASQPISAVDNSNIQQQKTASTIGSVPSAIQTSAIIDNQSMASFASMNQASLSNVTNTFNVTMRDLMNMTISYFDKFSSNQSFTNLNADNISIKNYKELYDLIYKNIELSQSSIGSYVSNMNNKKTEVITPKQTTEQKEEQTNVYALNTSITDLQNNFLNKLSDYFEKNNKKQETTTEASKESFVKEVKYTHIHEFRAQNGVIDPVARSIMAHPDFAALFTKELEFTSPISTSSTKGFT